MSWSECCGNVMVFYFLFCIVCSFDKFTYSGLVVQDWKEIQWKVQ